MDDLTKWELIQIERVLAQEIKKRIRQKEKKPAFEPAPGKGDAELQKIETMQSALKKIRKRKLKVLALEEQK